MLEKFFTVTQEGEQPLLDRLFCFLEPDGELEPILCGYFCKLVLSLFDKYQAKLVKYVFRENSNVMDNIFKHSVEKSISEIFIKFLSSVDY